MNVPQIKTGASYLSLIFSFYIVKAVVVILQSAWQYTVYVCIEYIFSWHGHLVK